MSRNVNAGLGTAAIIALTVAWWLRDEDWASSLGLNLATEIVGILITLLFVERIIRAQQEENRRRIARGALRKTRQSLQRMVRAFSNLLKGSLAAMPSPLPRSISELFSDDLVESFSHCNFGSVQWAPSGRGWAEYMNSALYDSLAGISAAIDMYGAFLPPEYVELLDELHDHVYIEYVHSMYPYIEQEQARTAGQEFPLDGRPDDRRNFFRTLRKAVELHNSIAEHVIQVPESFGNEDYAPVVGSLRIEAARRKAESAVEEPTPLERDSSGRLKAPPVGGIKLLDP